MSVSVSVYVCDFSLSPNFVTYTHNTTISASAALTSSTALSASEELFAQLIESVNSKDVVMAITDSQTTVFPSNMSCNLYLTLNSSIICLSIKKSVQK